MTDWIIYLLIGTGSGAVYAAIEGGVCTPDLGGDASTTQMLEGVLTNL